METSGLTRSEITRRQRHRRKRNLTAALGGVILFFALIGVGICLFSLIRLGVRTVKSYAAPDETPKFYETYLAQIVGPDPEPYAALKAANPDWMLKTAVWATAIEGIGNKTYGFTQDHRMVIPEADILKNYEKYFGNAGASIFHTVTVNGTSFEYDQKLKCFYVPGNDTFYDYTFTPKVTAIKKVSGGVTLTVQYLAESGWTVKPNGTKVPPQPSKTMEYVLKGRNGSYTITAIRIPGAKPSSASSSTSSGASAAPASSATASGS